jgi:hypothetical protein
MSDIEEMVEEVRKPGVFKITDAIKERAFPRATVDIYLDEGLAYLISELDEAFQKTANSMDKNKSLNKKEVDEMISRRDEIMAQKEKLIEEMGGTKYTFHLEGISEGKRQDIYDQTLDKFPMKYEKTRNPYTGKMEKEEIDEVERDRYFSDLLWSAHIVKIISPDDEEQDKLTPEEATELRRALPAASSARISEKIERLRVASAAFMMSLNEDFLAKS